MRLLRRGAGAVRSSESWHFMAFLTFSLSALVPLTPSLFTFGPLLATLPFIVMKNIFRIDFPTYRTAVALATYGSRAAKVEDSGGSTHAGR